MNPNDLIVEYHRRDLGEAEEEALAQELAASPEAAERFAGLAAGEYRRFGLAEPGGRSWAPLWLAMALPLALGGAWLWMRPAPAGPLEVRALVEEDGGYRVARRHPPEASPAPEAEAPPVPRLVVRAEGPNGPFQIRVVDGVAAADGVYDARGSRVAALEPLGRGRFRWDGHDEHGRLVLGGEYQLRLSGDEGPLRQWVEIERR